jgi:transcriptional regulator of acetoin/glycerol metabolism
VPLKRPPLSFEGYERMAILRALAEGDGVAGGLKLLKTSRRTLYRRMQVLGIPAGATYRIAPNDPVRRSRERVSFGGYERAVIMRALAAVNGDVDRAAKLLRRGRATVYRKIAKFGIGNA